MKISLLNYIIKEILKKKIKSKIHIINFKFKHFLDEKNKRDLIISLSSYNNIKVWILIFLISLNLIKINVSGYLFSSCFLNDNNQIYILATNFFCLCMEAKTNKTILFGR